MARQRHVFVSFVLAGRHSASPVAPIGATARRCTATIMTEPTQSSEGRCRRAACRRQFHPGNRA